MKIKLIPTPTAIVLSPATYHGTLWYSPVHPNQNTPTTSIGAPNIAPISLSSAGGNPRHFTMSRLYLRVVYQLMIEPIVVPMPMPIKVRPVWEIVKWWRTVNTIGKAWNTEQDVSGLKKIKQGEEAYVRRVNRRQLRHK